MTCEEGGEEGGGNADGRKEGRELVTKPKGKHAQQCSKKSGQTEANGQQRRNGTDKTIREGASVHHIPRDRSQIYPG